MIFDSSWKNTFVYFRVSASPSSWFTAFEPRKRWSGTNIIGFSSLFFMLQCFTRALSWLVSRQLNLSSTPKHQQYYVCIKAFKRKVMAVNTLFDIVTMDPMKCGGKVEFPSSWSVWFTDRNITEFLYFISLFKSLISLTVLAQALLKGSA